MSLTVSAAVIGRTSHPSFDRLRKIDSIDNDRLFLIDADLSGDALADLAQASAEMGDGKTSRALAAIQAVREGKFSTPIPNFRAALDILTTYLRHAAIDGWIYVRWPDGHVYPELVAEVVFHENWSHRNSEERDPQIVIRTTFVGRQQEHDRGPAGSSMSVRMNRYTLRPGDVARKRPADALAAIGILKETEELKRQYEEEMARHRETTSPAAFQAQFRVCGRIHSGEESIYRGRGEERQGRRVIHDLPASECPTGQSFVESPLLPHLDGEASATTLVPEHPLVRVFDLQAHEFYWIHGSNLAPYAYDKSLRHKLILPESHRDLLDVLTTETEAFSTDIIEGKSAGNVVLCKGIPGVGKTLTAEVYAELIERPLYSIRSGELGVTAAEIEGRLRDIFQRAKRWDCVLLLDEADVFVAKRGASIEQNAIVAEFLRALEYFAGLLFLTTNRVDDIDEAIISRCAAIIGYEAPGEEDARAIWGVMAGHHGIQLGTDLLDGLVSLFPQITPRDIKMLLRLTLRMAASKAKAPGRDPAAVTIPSLDEFRRCAMFRAIKIKV